MKVHGINQNEVTIENILHKNINVGVIANSDLSFSHQIVELKSLWSGIGQPSQVVYGITLAHLLSTADKNNEQYVLFKPAYCDTYKLMEVSTGKEVAYYHSIEVSDKIYDNYSEFDGIKFKFVKTV